MISKSSYTTTFGNMFPIQKTIAAIKESLVGGGLASRSMGVHAQGNTKVVFVTGLDSDEDKIPVFVHPILIENFKNSDYVVSDIRSYRPAGSDWMSDAAFEEGIRNKADYGIVKTRAVLEAKWNEEGPLKIRPMFKFAGNVYANWISQAVTRIFALDNHDQYRIMAVALYFYYTRFVNGGKLTDDDLEAASNHTIKLTGLAASEIYSIFEKLPQMENLGDFCEAVKLTVENIRLNDFNYSILLTGLRNSYYGNNAKAMIEVAVEHPPTWISIVIGVMNERSFKSSPLYKLIEMQGKRGGIDEFRLNYLSFLKNSMVSNESIEDRLAALESVEF